MVSIRGVFTSAVALLAVPALAAVTPAELTATADISRMQGSAPVTAIPDAVAIAGAFRNAGGLSLVDSIQSAADRNQIAADRKSLESAFQAVISAYRGIAGPTKRHVRDFSA
ncbi:hypothetical protein B0T24DRAFT_674368 [Lasiosphaeria ovina]|uniref:Uncharacterized protein n=1 Tax=Lasiosphaeria ovina TaxID=92902 RepID=A0AAE0TYX4_9PEZI|nr:hypothetical protein B0T24DRAFT_674368 [Lasiosphaeria ovina]